MVLAAADPIAYLPVVSTAIAAVFATALFRHWRQKPHARYLLWWFVGVTFFGIGTLAEALTTIFGWHEVYFRAWYIAGALLGGAPLAQGTVYLLLKRRTADRLAIALVAYAAIAATFVLLAPVDAALAEADRLSGRVIEWGWVRGFSPLLNVYALVFLVGGAAWSAIRYRRHGEGARNRVRGNWLIAIGALLPGIGGAATRAGSADLLYIAEVLGLLLIWLGYRSMVGTTSPSIHSAQREGEQTRTGR